MIAGGVVVARLMLTAEMQPGSVWRNSYSSVILPPWYLLPYYALMRGLYEVLPGMIVGAMALLLPVVWPWLRADLARTGRGRVVFLLAWASCVAAYGTLGWSGTQPPEEAALLIGRVAACVLFGFVAVTAVLGRRA